MIRGEEPAKYILTRLGDSKTRCPHSADVICGGHLNQGFRILRTSGARRFSSPATLTTTLGMGMLKLDSRKN
jgi:hypothetical protein